MPYVIAAPAIMASAATDLATIGSNLVVAVEPSPYSALTCTCRDTYVQR
jgi:hypothetical protein